MDDATKHIPYINRSICTRTDASPSTETDHVTQLKTLETGSKCSPSLDCSSVIYYDA